MIDFLIDLISKPLAGLAIVVRLFGTHGPDPNDPSIESLKFVRIADSVFVEALVRNGLTPEIKDLVEGGVVVKTACTFTCGTFSKQWERVVQYNPVKRSGCCLLPDGTCGSTFKEDALALHFNRIVFFLADCEDVNKMKSMPAKLTISTSTRIEAMEIGRKELWPDRIVAEFGVPELSKSK